MNDIYFQNIENNSNDNMLLESKISNEIIYLSNHYKNKQFVITKIGKINLVMNIYILCIDIIRTHFLYTFLL